MHFLPHAGTNLGCAPLAELPLQATALVHQRDTVTTPEQRILVCDSGSLTSELQYRQEVHVSVYHKICDVAVDKHLTRRQAKDFIRRHAGVAASDPKICASTATVT